MFRKAVGLIAGLAVASAGFLALNQQEAQAENSDNPCNIVATAPETTPIGVVPNIKVSSDACPNTSSAIWQIMLTPYKIINYPGGTYPIGSTSNWKKVGPVHVTSTCTTYKIPSVVSKCVDLTVNVVDPNAPSEEPSAEPTEEPTEEPTAEPTEQPSEEPAKPNHCNLTFDFPESVEVSKDNEPIYLKGSYDDGCNLSAVSVDDSDYGLEWDVSDSRWPLARDFYIDRSHAHTVTGSFNVAAYYDGQNSSSESFPVHYSINVTEPSEEPSDDVPTTEPTDEPVQDPTESPSDEEGSGSDGAEDGSGSDNSGADEGNSPSDGTPVEEPSATPTEEPSQSPTAEPTKPAEPTTAPLVATSVTLSASHAYKTTVSYSRCSAQYKHLTCTSQAWVKKSGKTWVKCSVQTKHSVCQTKAWMKTVTTKKPGAVTIKGSVKPATTPVVIQIHDIKGWHNWRGVQPVKGAYVHQHNSARKVWYRAVVKETSKVKASTSGQAKA